MSKERGNSVGQATQETIESDVTLKMEVHPMEVIYQRRCARYIYVVPEGLRELMTDISREVLRCQPEEMCCFIADYLESLIVIRENAKVASKFVEDIVEKGTLIGDLTKRTNLPLEKIHNAARIIQNAFRRYWKEKYGRDIVAKPDADEIAYKISVSLGITWKVACMASVIIQRAWRSYRQRKVFWKKYGLTVNWREAVRYTLAMYKKYAPTYEFNKAATTIAAAYRGYYTRRYIKLLLKQQKLRMLERLDKEQIISYLKRQYAESEVEEEEEFRGVYTFTQESSEEVLNPDDPAWPINKAFKYYMKTNNVQPVNVFIPSTIKEEEEEEGDEIPTMAKTAYVEDITEIVDKMKKYKEDMKGIDESYFEG